MTGLPHPQARFHLEEDQPVIPLGPGKTLLQYTFTVAKSLTTIQILVIKNEANSKYVF